MAALAAINYGFTGFVNRKSSFICAILDPAFLSDLDVLISSIEEDVIDKIPCKKRTPKIG